MFLFSQVFKLLRCVCETVLSQLSTSLGEDEELLQRPAADECMHAAISWRTSYKRYTHLGSIFPFHLLVLQLWPYQLVLNFISCLQAGICTVSCCCASLHAQKLERFVIDWAVEVLVCPSSALAHELKRSWSK